MWIERHRDVVDVVAGLKVAGDVRGWSLVEGLERRERSIVTKENDGRLNGGVEHVARHESAKRTMKELQPDRDLSQLFRFGVADDEEIVRAYAAPVVSRLRRGGCWECEEYEQE